MLKKIARKITKLKKSLRSYCVRLQGAVSAKYFFRLSGALRDLGRLKRARHFKRYRKSLIRVMLAASAGSIALARAWPTLPLAVAASYALGVAASLAGLMFALGTTVSLLETFASSATGRWLRLVLLRAYRRNRHNHLPMLRDLEEYEARGRRDDCDER